MPAVARQGDSFSTGHGCTAKSTLTGPSEDVFINGKGVERKDDPSVSHTILVGLACVPHVIRIKSGSETVFVNGKPIARVDDPIDNGKILTGSPDVNAG